MPFKLVHFEPTIIQHDLGKRLTPRFDTIEYFSAYIYTAHSDNRCHEVTKSMLTYHPQLQVVVGSSVTGFGKISPRWQI